MGLSARPNEVSAANVTLTGRDQAKEEYETKEEMTLSAFVRQAAIAKIPEMMQNGCKAETLNHRFAKSIAEPEGTESDRGVE